MELLSGSEHRFGRLAQGATPSLDKVPLAYRAELDAMEDLSDKELWEISQSCLTPARQRRLATLLGKNQREKLTALERTALTSLARLRIA